MTKDTRKERNMKQGGGSRTANTGWRWGGRRRTADGWREGREGQREGELTWTLAAASLSTPTSAVT